MLSLLIPLCVVLQNRNFITETMKNIFDRLQSAGYDNIRYEKAGKNRRRVLSEHHSDVYEEAIREFHERCININEVSRVLTLYARPVPPAVRYW